MDDAIETIWLDELKHQGDCFWVVAEFRGVESFSILHWGLEVGVGNDEIRSDFRYFLHKLSVPIQLLEVLTA